MRRICKRAFALGLVLAMLLSICAVTMAADPPKNNSQAPIVTMFADVEDTDSNAAFINYVAKRDLIKGFPDGGFHPGEALTRAQAATLLVKAGGIKTGTAGSKAFKDVPTTHWAAANIAAASNAGYLKGFPDGSFKPEDQLTRAQGISLFLRLSKQSLGQAQLPVLQDMNAGHWAASAVATALDAKMIGLSADKKNFYPDRGLSRGDLARALAILLTKDPDLNQVSLIPSLRVKSGDVKVGSASTSGTKVLKTGDIVETAANGEAEITFPDGSGILLKGNTVLVIKETKGRSYIKTDGSLGTGVEFLNVELKQGRIFGALASTATVNPQTAKGNSMSAKLSSLLASLADKASLLFAAGDKEAPWYKTAEQKKVKVKVDMPWGIAAIRGSFWSNVVTDKINTTSLLEGSASMSGNNTQSLNPGQSTSIIAPNSSPSTPAGMSQAEQSAWVGEKGWVQSRAEAIQANQEAPQVQLAPGEQPAPPAQAITETLNQAMSQVESSVASITSPTTSTSSGGGGGGSSSTASVAIVNLNPSSVALYTTGAAYEIVSFQTSVAAVDVINAVYNAAVVRLEIPNLTTNPKYAYVFQVGAGQTTVTLTPQKTGYVGAATSFTATVYTPLAQVTGVAWQAPPNCRKVSWTGVANAAGYRVNLYKGASASLVGSSTVGAAVYEADLTTMINNDIASAGVGDSYTAKVIASGNAASYISDSEEAATSTARCFLAQAGIPSWTASDTISWSAVPNASSFEVKLYEDGAAIAKETHSIVPGTTTCTFTQITAGHSYTASVQALGDGTTYFNGPVSTTATGKTVLAQVAQPTWTNRSSVLNWAAASGAPRYQVALYRGGSAAGTYTVNAPATSYDFGTTLTGTAGDYTATVQAIGDGSANYVAGTVSASAAAMHVLAPVSGAQWRNANGTLVEWTDVTGESGYKLVLKRDGTQVTTATAPANAITYDFAVDMATPGIYVFTIQATNPASDYIDGAVADSASMKVLAQAAAPTWADKSRTLTWTAVDNAIAYQVLLTPPSGPSKHYDLGNVQTFGIPAGDMSDAGSYTASIMALGDGTNSYTNGSASPSSASMMVLAQVAQPTWSAANISWVDVTGENGYVVKLFKDAEKISTLNLAADTTAQSFGPIITANGAGSYTVTVQAVNNGNDYIDGQVSTVSAARVVTALGSVGSPGWTGKNLYWSNVANESGYRVTLYKNGTWLAENTTAADVTAYDFTSAITSNGAGTYKASVQAVGDGITYADGPVATSGDYSYTP